MTMKDKCKSLADIGAHMTTTPEPPVEEIPDDNAAPVRIADLEKTDVSDTNSSDFKEKVLAGKPGKTAAKVTAPKVTSAPVTDSPAGEAPEPMDDNISVTLVSKLKTIAQDGKRRFIVLKVWLAKLKLKLTTTPEPVANDDALLDSFFQNVDLLGNAQPSVGLLRAREMTLEEKDLPYTTIGATIEKYPHLFRR